MTTRFAWTSSTSACGRRCSNHPIEGGVPARRRRRAAAGADGRDGQAEGRPASRRSASSRSCRESGDRGRRQPPSSSSARVSRRACGTWDRVSLVVHGVAAADAADRCRRRRCEDDAPTNVMTISLGGAPGAATGGMTTMGGRTGAGGRAGDKHVAGAAGGEGAGDGAADEEASRRSRRRRRRRTTRRTRSRTPKAARSDARATRGIETGAAAPGSVCRPAAAADRRLPRRRELLLPRIPRDDDPADPAELEGEAGRRRARR